MFSTQEEMRRGLSQLDARTRYEITYRIEQRETGRRAAVTLAGVPSQMLAQAEVVWDDGWGICEIIEMTRRNNDCFRIPRGANRTQYGY